MGVTLSGTNLSGATAVNVSGAGVTCGITGFAATTVSATCDITVGASTGARNVTVTTPGGTSGAVTFTVGACAATSGGITPAVVASRTSGVAPLSVFFDATATTATATTRPFHELGYGWDFGDPGSGEWSKGSRAGTASRDVANGPVAAHVYETPGTYTVTLTVKDGTNTAVQSCTQIMVQDPVVVFAGPNTLCFSNTADFTGCPAGAQQMPPTGDFDDAINTNVGTGRRLLFKRGDIFTVAAADPHPVINATGPITIGAFGAGNVPVVELSANIRGLQLSTSGTPAVLSDVRVMDLEIDGNSGASTVGVDFRGGFNNVLLLRLNIHHLKTGVSAALGQLPAGHELWNGISIVDSNIHNLDHTTTPFPFDNGGNGVFMGAQRYAIMGTAITDSTKGEHILRNPYLYKAYIAHNDLSNPAPTKGVIKIHAFVTGVNVPTPQSELIVLNGNKFTSGTGGDWTVNLGPQDETVNELVRDVIVENNWFAPHAGQQRALMNFAQSVTVRNNIFDLTGTLARVGVDVSVLLDPPAIVPVAPAPIDVHVYNNTFYSDSGGAFSPITFRQGAGHIARNNLGYAPNSTGGTMVSVLPPGTATFDNNTSDASILVSPNFTSATPSVPEDFSLGAGSYAINAGTAVPVFSDFLGLSRPLGVAFDLGFIERE